jgi:uncharacterized membrane protein YqjE
MTDSRPRGRGDDEPTLGALVHQLTQQIPELVRAEVRLAQAELAEKGKRAGVGIGMFAAAGVLAWFGTAALVATVILALALTLPAWASALVVGAALLAAAAVVGLLGRRQVVAATPASPERAIEGIKEDLATIRGRHR